MRIQISGARLIDPANQTDRICDIFIEGGKIAALGDKPSGFSVEQLIDARGLIAAPGLVDINASLREPGFGRKGNIASETRAAAAGGVTSLCCTPFTKPVLDTPAVAELILDQTRDHGASRVYPLGALTRELAGEHLAELVTLRDAGCVAFTNGLTPLASNRLLRHALEYAATFDLTVIFQPQDRELADGGIAHEGAAASFRGLAGIPETAETVALSRDLLLVEQSGVRAHFSQITTARGARLIAKAQQRGLPVTADVALYQLLLTDEALLDFSSLYHVLPPLRSLEDREGLREAVRSGVISAIASHHQPHEVDAKRDPFAATEPGISSIELMLPLTMSLVQEGVLDLATALERLTCGPARAMRLNAGTLSVGARADLVLFDPEGQTLAGEHWLSRGNNCPFLGHHLPARVRYTLLNGRISHKQD